MRTWIGLWVHCNGRMLSDCGQCRPMYLLGYWDVTNRLYLTDKDLTIVSYQLHMSVIEYQTAVMKGDLETADKVCLV